MPFPVVTQIQYAPYCGNQCPARLLIAVLLYFLWVRRHEYAAAVMVLSRKYSLTYGLTLTHLSYAANLSGAMIRCAPTHMVLKMHIIEISELKLRSNKLSGRGDTYSVAWGKLQLGTLRCGWLRSQRLTDSIGQNSLFYREVWRYCNMHAHGHEDVTTHRHGARDYSRGQWAPNGCLPHTLGWEAHRIGLLDQYRGLTKYKKVRSCDTYFKLHYL